jgi:hypothetical protein
MYRVVETNLGLYVKYCFESSMQIVWFQEGGCGLKLVTVVLNLCQFDKNV